MPLSHVLLATLAASTTVSDAHDLAAEAIAFNEATFAPKLAHLPTDTLGDEPTQDQKPKDLLERPSVPDASLPPPPPPPPPPPAVMALATSLVAAPAASIPVPAELRGQVPVAAMPMAPPPVVALPNPLAPQTNVLVVHHPVDPRSRPQAPVWHGVHNVNPRPALGALASASGR